MSDANRPPKKAGKGSYAVGYARPPAHSRVQKGQVLNPHGRKGKPKTAPDPFDMAMSQTATVNIDGRQERRTVEEAMYLQLAAKAVKGDIRAFSALARARQQRVANGPSQEEIEEQIREEQQRQENAKQLMALLEQASERLSQRELFELGILIETDNGDELAPWAREAALARKARAARGA